jgi:hypothetical protein
MRVLVARMSVPSVCIKRRITITSVGNNGILTKSSLPTAQAAKTVKYNGTTVIIVLLGVSRARFENSKIILPIMAGQRAV